MYSHAMQMPEPVERRDLVVVACVTALLALGATWPLALRLASGLPSDLGDPVLNTTILGWNANRLAHGLVGYWDAPFFFPYENSLAYSEHLFGIAIFTAPVQWLTGNPVLAYNLAFLAAPVLAAVGGYGLAHELWGRRDAAWLAALALAFAPYRADHPSHLQVLVSGWMPMALWAFHRYFRTGSRRALAGFVAAFLLQALSNGYFLFFFSIAVALIGATELLALVTARAAKNPTPTRPVRLLAELLVASCLVGAALAPVARAYGSAQRDVGLRRSTNEAIGFSARPGDYLRAPAALAVWGPALGQAPPERSVFPGLTIVVLAAIGVGALMWPGRASGPPPVVRRHVAAYAGLGALAFWLSLGPNHAAYGFFLNVLPGFDGLRVPARFVVLVVLALALVGSAGAAWILSRLRTPARALGATVVFAAAIVADGWPRPIHIETFRPSQRQRSALHAWLEKQPQGAMLELPVSAEDVSFTPAYDYATLLHGRRIVNGYSGWGTPLQAFLAAQLGGPFRADVDVDGILAGLSALGVRFVVLHRSEYTRQQPGIYSDPQAVIAAIDRSPLIDARETMLPIQAWRLKPVERDSVRLDGTTLVERTAYDTAGAGPLTLTFSSPRNLATVELAVPEAVAGAYPRTVRIISMVPSGETTTLFDGSTLPALLEALVRTPRSPVVTIGLPPNSSSQIRIEHVDGTADRPWRADVSAVRMR